VWALGIVALGFAPSLALGLVCLAVAGAADMVSGVFRGTIWNETIPNALRGRLAGIEMISYLTGPLVGNARAGFMADAWGVVATGFLLPRFWAYRSSTAGG
jgi:MFS family permease